MPFRGVSGPSDVEKLTTATTLLGIKTELLANEEMLESALEKVPGDVSADDMDEDRKKTLIVEESIFSTLDNLTDSIQEGEVDPEEFNNIERAIYKAAAKAVPAGVDVRELDNVPTDLDVGELGITTGQGGAGPRAEGLGGMGEVSPVPGGGGGVEGVGGGIRGLAVSSVQSSLEQLFDSNTLNELGGARQVATVIVDRLFGDVFGLGEGGQ